MAGELPPRLLQALSLRDQLYSYNEIAKKMKISKSTVATYLWTARKLGLVIECDRHWAKKLRKERISAR